MAEPHELDIELSSPAEERTWLKSTALWSVLGGVATIITASTAVLAVYVGLDQVRVARQVQMTESTYSSWATFIQVTISNPELACPNTDKAYQDLLERPDPASKVGGAYRERYAAYSDMMFTTFEQILQMAPDDPRWAFIIAERVQCHAPAIHALQAQPAYAQRYSCQLRQVIAGALDQAVPNCRKDAL